MTPLTPLPHAGAAPCPENGPEPDTERAARLFPPRDADRETYRAWLVASPWPEVVFASAGAR